ncbi:EAL domain-containing protein [Egibacter rhizosphaerae]|uniref:EAL domain-containing protein n=1 Tax=Egibacter rhizosphaerae TaxID=1670831 RepID=A0A411YKG0_9ACTN|nr:EAL domain-containing protein [Egibacter rhizosphaerae]QBI21676.1 EAL domain-containing protein [Egibacter rhizosphaerae]
MTSTRGGNRPPAAGRRTAVARAVHRAAGAGSIISVWWAVGAVVGMVVLSWGASWLLGGAARVVPHWYYFPVLFAALRFGHVGALVVALASGLLAGPLTPELVGEGTAQNPSEWLTRTVFFVAVGQVAALLVQPSLPSLTADVRRRRTERSIRGALARGEFELHFQPVLSVAHGETVGAEALIRWRDPQRGLLPAGAFMPEVERTETIHEVGAWVLREACAHAAAWPDDRAWVAVNLSGAELDSPDLPRRVASTLERTGLPPARLCIEITETVLVEDFEGSRQRLDELAGTGVRVAIDDFGTGFSSLAYAHRFPADVLKIDRSFVAALETDPQGGAMVGSIVILARTLGMRTIAEGVETQVQQHRLPELGCDMAQGYHYHRPMPAGDLDVLLRAQQFHRNDAEGAAEPGGVGAGDRADGVDGTDRIGEADEADREDPVGRTPRRR